MLGLFVGISTALLAILVYPNTKDKYMSGPENMQILKFILVTILFSQVYSFFILLVVHTLSGK